MKKITNTMMPITPRRAMNLSFSIFLTMVKGISANTTIIMIKYSDV